MKRQSGNYELLTVGGETVRAFLPLPLPPANPVLAIDELAGPRRSAEAALAQLELAGTMVPSMSWFLYSFVRKEAVVSSQIEGTQATLMDLLTFEAGQHATPGAPEDVEEVCNYIDAMNYARDQMRRPRGLPLSVRLLNETHRRLLKGVRGEDKQPGTVRRSQNWIGGTRPGTAVYVPPPAHAVVGLYGELEHFVHGERDFPPIVRAGLAHVQFETIHPYLDGNGRLGRLLIILLLEHWGLLSLPLLYLSLFFKQHQTEYYRRLNAVRNDGDFEGWLEFFLEGTTVVAKEAVDAIRDLSAMVNQDRSRILAAPTTSVNAVRLFELLPDHPVITIAGAVSLLGSTKPTTSKAVGSLIDAGVLEETTGRRRDRIFAYSSYLDRLRAGTELENG